VTATVVLVQELTQVESLAVIAASLLALAILITLLHRVLR
jgi:hypothetical protein